MWGGGGAGVRTLFCYAVLCVLSSFAIICAEKGEPVALLLWSSSCHVAVIVLFHFLMLSCVGLQRIIVSFPGHTHILYKAWTNCLYW